MVLRVSLGTDDVSGVGLESAEKPHPDLPHPQIKITTKT